MEKITRSTFKIFLKDLKCSLSKKEKATKKPHPDLDLISIEEGEAGESGEISGGRRGVGGQQQREEGGMEGRLMRWACGWTV